MSIRGTFGRVFGFLRAKASDAISAFDDEPLEIAPVFDEDLKGQMREAIQLKASSASNLRRATERLLKAREDRRHA